MVVKGIGPGLRVQWEHEGCLVTRLGEWLYPAWKVGNEGQPGATPGEGLSPRLCGAKGNQGETRKRSAKRVFLRVTRLLWIAMPTAF